MKMGGVKKNSIIKYQLSPVAAKNEALSRSAPSKAPVKLATVTEMLTAQQLQLKKLVMPGMSQALRRFSTKITNEKEMVSSSKENVVQGPAVCECGKKLALGTIRCPEPCIVVRDTRKKYGMRRSMKTQPKTIGILKPRVDLDE